MCVCVWCEPKRLSTFRSNRNDFAELFFFFFRKDAIKTSLMFHNHSFNMVLYKYAVDLHNCFGIFDQFRYIRVFVCVGLC